MNMTSPASEKSYVLGLYEKAIPADLSWEEKMNVCRDCGFDFIEISLDESGKRQSRLKDGNKEVEEMIDAIGSNGITIDSINISALKEHEFRGDDEEFRGAIALVKRAVDLAEKIGAGIVQLTSFPFYESVSHEERERLFTAFVKEAAEYAETKNVIFSFETMPNGFNTNSMTAARVIDNVGSKNLKYYADLGNLIGFGTFDKPYDRNSDVVVDDLNKAAGKIIGCHVKETNRFRQRRIEFGSGEGHTQYVKHFECLRQLGCRMFMAEFWDKGDDQIARIGEAGSYLRSYLDEVFE